jgi:hypothetical protein
VAKGEKKEKGKSKKAKVRKESVNDNVSKAMSETESLG